MPATAFDFLALLNCTDTAGKVGLTLQPVSAASQPYLTIYHADVMVHSTSSGNFGILPDFHWRSVARGGSQERTEVTILRWTGTLKATNKWQSTPPCMMDKLPLHTFLSLPRQVLARLDVGY